MGSGALPGPTGGIAKTAPGPLGTKPAKPEPKTPGPAGTKAPPAKAIKYTEAELSAGEAELELLRKTFKGVLDKRAKHVYWSHGKDGKWHYRTDDYLTDRNKFFGSASDYAAYLTTARSELDSGTGRLRKVIEPSGAARKGEWKAGQDVFYAWVRKAYENKLGKDTDIAKLICAGNSEELKAALARVRVDYPTPFSAGGFNPRPIKTTRGYRFGTISDHALGTAVDIESGKNAQVEPADWLSLCALAGESLNAATRKTKWKTAPKELHDAVVRVNNAFVARLKSEMDKQRAKGVKADNLVAAACAADADLNKVSIKFVTEWSGGFFTLPWDLVKALHDEGFLWGATFDRADLHHFQL